MEKSWRKELLEIVAASEPIARKLRAIDRAQWPVRFSHVTQPAQAFLVATIAHRIDRTIWILCPNVHSQELIFESLLNWHPTALFLPEAEFTAVENVLPDPEIAAERLALLTQVEREAGPHLIVATRASLDQAAPGRDVLQSGVVQLRRGANVNLEDLVEQLAGAGYERVAQVATRGQFAVRGGIVDLYSWQAPLPVRLEFFGDEIDSLREFDIDTQTSLRELTSVDILLGATQDQSGVVRDYISRDYLAIEIVPEKTSDAHIQISEGWIEIGPEDFSGAFVAAATEVGEFAIGDLMLIEAKRAQFCARLEQWRANKAKIVIYFQTEGEIERFREVMGEKEALDDVDLLEGTLAHGFCFPGADLVVLSAAELFGRLAAHPRRRLHRAERRRAQIDFNELTEGDFVAHLEHGVGRFLGLIRLAKSPYAVEAGVSPDSSTSAADTAAATEDRAQEVLALEFADEAKLYVPLEQAYLVSRYVGVGKRSPALSSLGDARWTRAKKNAAASIFDYAGKMLAVQAERQMHPGHAYTKIDMERPQPMDRLICGDVGFGKTEVAIRAAFKGVMDGKQVAVLAPTTVLAQQHFEVFRQRMLDYPVRIEMLSRFRSQGEQKKILQLLREGGVDIVIGTHRLISGDIVFKDLGLVVIDEEQRFGVLHKEKFKELFKLVDVLTLSATPIPRTLYLSLVGVKDMSTIETPPLNRLPVETMVSAYDERIIRDAINRELERQGQVFFLHNRVQTIERARDRIIHLCPQARVEIGHGQMGSDELEAVMARFVAGKVDVLVCTTIIESGLDIPNANTIIIDRADRFGLADLYQLRGRVGRAEHKAYAYLLLPREMMAIGAARKRINAIKQYSSLGAGFRIAMRDLEIRGAGSILGTAQSGHIMTVGFDLYCQLLKQAVAQLKGEKVQRRLDVDLRLDFVATNEAEFVQQPKPTPREADSFLSKVPAFIPTTFISDGTLRIKAYREIAEITAPDQLDRLRRDWRDRFGPFPVAVDNLSLLTEIKVAAAKFGVSRVEVRDRKLMLTRHEDFILVAGKFPRLVAAGIEQYLGEILELIKKL